MQRRTFLRALGCVPALAMPARAAAAPQTGTKGRHTRHGRGVGIAFGGGSIHGIAHVGVLKAFIEKELPIHFIAGTSVGAIIGALVAARLPYVEIEQIARRIEWPGLSSLAWSGKGLMQNAKLRSMVDTALGDRRIEQLPIPFGVVATDVATGERVVIRKGSVGTAVEASSAIPVLFVPVKIDGRDLIDGGLTEPVPVIAVREMGADIVIGIDVAFRPAEEPVQGMAGVAFQTMHIMANALIKEQIGRADVAIRMNLHQFIGNDHSHEQLIAAGHAATMREWPKIASMLAG
ncbi:MAG: patatin-like phospholipase family protein [Betaproteobacteria bacterium]